MKKKYFIVYIKGVMPTMKMNLYSQNQLSNIHIQYLTQQLQSQVQPLLRLGSTSNRSFMPLLIQGNKSCKSCSGK